MTIINCKCIPEIIDVPEKLNIDNYKKYEDDLYQILKQDFVDHEVIFLGKRVYLDFNKIENGKSDTFFHVVCGDKKAYPNFRRMERIKFPRQIIENYNECTSCIESCKIKMFYKKIKGKHRYHLFSKEYRYMVVLEDEGKRMKLVTSFYVDKGYMLHNYDNDYKNYIQENEDGAIN